MPEIPSLSPLPGPRADETLRTIERLAAVAQQKGLAYDLSTLSAFVSSGNAQFQHSGPPLRVHDSNCSWDQHYSVLSMVTCMHITPSSVDGLGSHLVERCSGREF